MSDNFSFEQRLVNRDIKIFLRLDKERVWGGNVMLGGTRTKVDDKASQHLKQEPLVSAPLADGPGGRCCQAQGQVRVRRISWGTSFQYDLLVKSYGLLVQRA